MEADSTQPALRKFLVSCAMTGGQWGLQHSFPRDWRTPHGRHTRSTDSGPSPLFPPCPAWDTDVGCQHGDAGSLWLLVGFGHGGWGERESKVRVPPLGSLSLWVTTGWTCPWLKATAPDCRSSQMAVSGSYNCPLLSLAHPWGCNPSSTPRLYGHACG